MGPTKGHVAFVLCSVTEMPRENVDKHRGVTSIEYIKITNKHTIYLLGESYGDLVEPKVVIQFCIDLPLSTSKYNGLCISKSIPN